MLWSCSNVSVRYRHEDGEETAALTGISLSIGAGERVAIVGRNGSGKSTLALAIAGLLRPTAGTILFHGTPVNSPTAAIVFQSPDDNLIGETVREEFQLCLERRTGPEEIERAINEAIERFGLTNLADRATSQLSGGEKQIVALACALCAHRELIVLDEPTSHLDSAGKELLWKFLESFTGHPCSRQAIVVVTQYTEEVRHFPRLIVLDSGKIAYDGASSGYSTDGQVSRRRCPFTPRIEAEPILSVRDLTQVSTPAWPLPDKPVRNVTLDIRPGERIALCGPIGSGKTTLALLLAGLIPQHAGERHMIGAPPVMLIQFPERQIFCNSVEDEVAYGLMARGDEKSVAIQKAHDALQHVGLSPETFAKRDPFSLSGGQKRRVMLAAATVLDSPLFILDEPQAALDDDGLEAIARFCESWSTKQTAYIMISHDHVFLSALTDRVVCMESGVVRYDGGWAGFKQAAKPLSDSGFSESGKTWI